MPLREADAVRGALETLGEALAPFVLGALKERHGDSWWVEGVARRMSAWEIQRITANAGVAWETLDDEAKVAHLDHRVLLALVAKNWIDTFEGRVTRPGRSYVEECRFIANRQAHLTRGHAWTMEDAFRAVDTIRRFLHACGDTVNARKVELIQRDLERSEGLPGRVAEATPQPWNPSNAKSPSPGSGGTSSTVAFPLKAAYRFAKDHGLDQESIRIGQAKPPGRTQGPPYRRALFVELFESQGVLSDFIAECWPHGATGHGERLLGQYRRLLRRQDPASAGRTPWEAVEDLIGSVEGPEDLAAEHDRYLSRRPTGGQSDVQ